MKHKNIKVSIITPTYNCNKYVRKTILSVLNQTYDNFEIIIVDDCSNDSTIEEIKRIKDERIKLFVNKKNQGAAYCRNLAISKATGDYIAFLDGDDLWIKNKLEEQLSFMIDNSIDFSYTNYYVLDDKENKICSYYTGPKNVNHKKFVKLDYVGCLTVMYKKSIYPELSIPNDIYKRNDYALWLKLSEKADCRLLNKNLAIYRSRTNSISSISKFKLIKYHKIVFNKLYGYRSLKSSLCAFRNVFHYVFKGIRYKKKVKEEVNYEF